LREEGGEADAARSSWRMSTTGIWEDAMGGSIWGFAGETNGEFGFLWILSGLAG
jgi:hypothetical protein